MADVGQALWIYILAREQQISPAAHVHNGLNQVRYLLIAQLIFVLNVARTRPRPCREQRNYAGMRESDRLIQKFAPIEVGGILPIPMPPKDRGEGPLPFRNHKRCLDSGAFGV